MSREYELSALPWGRYVTPELQDVFFSVPLEGGPMRLSLVLDGGYELEMLVTPEAREKFGWAMRSV
jgi:hypothetical protein